MPRLLYLDISKACAITLVCIGHAALLVSIKGESIIYNWIYSFHMPLFMLICGYFSIHAFQKSFRAFLSNKIRCLIIPTISFSMIEFLADLIMLYPNNLSENAYVDAVGSMWFLRTLFACYIYVYIIKLIHLNDIWLSLVSITIALFFPHGYFLQFNFLILFFWTGYFIRKYTIKYNKHRLEIMILSLVFFLIFGRHEPPVILYYNVIFKEPLLILWQFVTGVAGSLSIVSIIYYICKYNNSWFIDAIGRVGKYTLGIYGVQTIIILKLFKALIKIDLSNYSSWIGDFIVTPILGIFSTIICYYIVILLSKNKTTNKILFGSQYH